mmetsp:Transcript_99536/g.121751  ORF Transcript_99536/g.121751 Transcript_99536/m.121751 type:complete len:92 (+) Transcript_99536:248-523(+)
MILQFNQQLHYYLKLYQQQQQQPQPLPGLNGIEPLPLPQQNGNNNPQQIMNGTPMGNNIHNNNDINNNNNNNNEASLDKTIHRRSTDPGNK